MVKVMDGIAGTAGFPVNGMRQAVHRRRQRHPLQCSRLENPMDGGAWGAAVHGVAESRTRLSDFTLTHTTYSTMEFTYLNVPASLVAQRLKHLPAMRETRVRSLVQKDPLEKEIATHFSVLAWRIPWMEDPGGLQSMGSQRVGHD